MAVRGVREEEVKLAAVMPVDMPVALFRVYAVLGSSAAGFEDFDVEGGGSDGVLLERSLLNTF